MATIQDPFSRLSDTQGFTHLVASCLALAQTIHIVPKQTRWKSLLWGFLLFPATPYVANMASMHAINTAARHVHKDHPVDVLVKDAEDKFNEFITRQSTTYQAAVQEYKRRYSIEPPPGFEAWYNYAKIHNSPIIDDYDMIWSSISPFLTMSGQEVREAINAGYNAPNSELWLCTLSNGTSTTSCRHARRRFDRNFGKTFTELLGNVNWTLPNVEFLINHLDEPRVLVPAESSRRDKFRQTGFLQQANFARQPTWSAITKDCRFEDKDSSKIGNSKRSISTPFVRNRKDSIDLCQHSEYEFMHGMFMHPTSFRLIEGLVPVLSTGSPSTMGDILYPSAAYNEAEFQYNEELDFDWDEKRNNLYWAGSNTGGYATSSDWKHYHRHRFVRVSQDLERQEYWYLRDVNGVFQWVKSYFLNTRLYDVAFTKMFQCHRHFCRDQSVFFGLKRRAKPNTMLKSRLVFDIDGNGISGRFYKLLASRSLPLKQTMLREWHDERLIPWYHYIPVSLSMEELPELVSYLTLDRNSENTARKIAEQGRLWFSKAFRNQDRAIYLYRLMLELARLQDPGRLPS